MQSKTFENSIQEPKYSKPVIYYKTLENSIQQPKHSKPVIYNLTSSEGKEKTLIE